MRKATTSNWARLIITSLIFACSAWYAYSQESRLNSALLDRCAEGKLKEVADLLTQGASANAADSGGTTALHRATQRGHLKVMRLLIDHRANVNAKDKMGRSVLTEAAGFRGSEAVKMLLAAGAKTDPSAFGQACWLGHMEMVKILLAAGADPNSGMTRAAQGRHVEILKFLLEKGANVNAKSNGNYTALHTGALQGGFNTVRFLLVAGANPNATNDKDETPLHLAIAGDGDIHTIQLLVRFGAKLNLPNHAGVTPVRLAAIQGAKDVYDWLLSINDGKEPMAANAGIQRPLITKSLQELFSALSTNKEEIRLAAQRELAARGQQIMPAVLKAMKSDKDIDRFYEVLAALGPDAEATIPLLTSQLSKKEHVFRAAVTMDRIKPGTLAGLPEETKQKAATALYQAIIDPDADVMAGFCGELLVQMGKSSAPTIMRLLQHKNPKYRELAARGMTSARFADETITAELRRLAMSDENRAVRATAVTALGAYGEPSAKTKEVLLSMLKNPPAYKPGEKTRDEMRQWWDTADHAARDSLARFGPSIIDDLIPLLSPMDVPTRRPAITALQNIGAPAVPRLIELLAHKDPSVAISASVALNMMGQPAVPGLAKALSTKNEQVINRATNALWWIGPGAKAALPSLFEVVGSENRSDVSRVVAVRAALKIDAASSRNSKAILLAVPVLIRVLDTGTFEQQGWAAEALGGIGASARDALPILRKRLELPDAKTDTGGLVADYVQRAAKQAISAIEADSK